MCQHYQDKGRVVELLKLPLANAAEAKNSWVTSRERSDV